MEIYLPPRAFTIILKFCDDRVEKYQKYHHQKTILLLNTLYLNYPVYHYNKVSRVIKHVKELREKEIKLSIKQKQEQKKKLKIKTLVWQYNYLRKINCSQKQTMNILLDRAQINNPITQKMIPSY